MKKPKIELNEVGAMGPDGIELKIGDLTFFCKKYAEAQAIEEMIDALIKAHKISGLWLPDMETVPPEHYGEAEALANMYSEIERALKKAGCK